MVNFGTLLTFLHFIILIAINNCQDSVCNNGNCLDEVGGYICVCDADFTGKNCTERGINSTTVKHIYMVRCYVDVI